MDKHKTYSQLRDEIEEHLFEEDDFIHYDSSEQNDENEEYINESSSEDEDEEFLETEISDIKSCIGNVNKKDFLRGTDVSECQNFTKINKNLRKSQNDNESGDDCIDEDLSEQQSGYEVKGEDECINENLRDDERSANENEHCIETEFQSSCNINWKLIEMKIEMLDEDKVLSEDHENSYWFGEEKITSMEKEKKKRAKHVRTQWVYMQEVQLSLEIWKKVYNADMKAIKKPTFKRYKNRIAKNHIDPIVGCIALLKGFHVGLKKVYQGNETLTLWMYCQHRPCHRKYKLSCNLRDAEAAIFRLYRSNNNQIHTKLLTRHIRQVDREDSMQRSLEKMPMAVRRVQIDNASVDMLEQYNLQDIVSDCVNQKIRYEAIESNDLHKDYIQDLEIMMEENDSFIQQLNMRKPFYVYIFSKIQCNVIFKLVNVSPDEERVGHLDATGGVIRPPYEDLKRIFYYACVMNLKINNDPVGSLIPIFEMVSDCQEAIFLAQWIFSFKMYFVARYPNIRTIFHRIVVDKSYALIHAILESFNNMNVKDYLLMSYEVVSGKLSKESDQFRKLTKVHICYTHTSKTFSKNTLTAFALKKHTDDTRLLLKVLQFIAKSKNYNEMKFAFFHLATLFLCEFENKEVEKSKKILEKLIEEQNENHGDHNIKNEFEDEEGEGTEGEGTEDEGTEDEEIKEKKKKQNENVMYASSPFYQDFETIIEERCKTFFLTIAEKKALLKAKQKENVFYNVKFIKTFTKNYISILPLWTGLLITDPNIIIYHNQHVESYFNISKESYRRKSIQLGKLPAKCGRFLRENIQRTQSDIKGFIWNIGKYRLASSYQNKKPRTKRKPKKKNSKKNMKKNSKNSNKNKNKTKNNTKRKRDRSDDEEDYISFANAKEEWWKNPRNKVPKKRKAKEFGEPRTYDSDKCNDYLSIKEAEEYFEFLARQQQRNSKKYFPEPISQGKVDVTDKFENGLIKDVRYYKRVKNFNYVVSVSSRFKLCSTDFSFLSNNQWFSNTLMEYLLKHFLQESKTVEGSCIEANVLFLQPDLDGFYKEFQKRFVLLPLCYKNHFVLFILDIKNRLISYIDSLGEKSNDFSKYINNFKIFLRKYNSMFKSIGKFPEWRVKFYTHCFQNDGVNCGPFVLRFCELFILKKDIYIEEFNPYYYREALKNMVINGSDDMKIKCLFCGQNENCVEENGRLIQCCICDRYLHIACSKVSMAYLEKELYVCPLCKS